MNAISQKLGAMLADMHAENKDMVFTAADLAVVKVEIDELALKLGERDREIEARKQLTAKIEATEIELRSRLDAVLGWRENDWPEWFDRRTAEAVADLARVVETSLLKSEEPK